MMITVLMKYKQIILYLVFGVSTTFVNWGIYSILIALIDMEMTMSNALAWAGAVAFAFVTNKLFVFESKEVSIKVLIREIFIFLSARIFSGLFEIFLPTFLYSLGLRQSFLGIDGFAAKAIVSVIVIILNYVLSKMVVFKKN